MKLRKLVPMKINESTVYSVYILIFLYLINAESEVTVHVDPVKV